ncbi:chemokine (C-X-C motif) ligand 18b [Pimephales promelas]|nr:chemokine (C-X-C motif) ligand 18b [Pimephales promelas]
MAFLPKVLPLLLLAVVCVQLSGVLANVRDRCWCVENLKKGLRKDTIEEFSVLPIRPYCDQVEIILKLKQASNSSKVIERCLDPNTLQGKNLQSCWKSKNINNTDTFKMSDCPMAQKASSQK